MIQANELRIGNWVLGNDGKPTMIEQIVPSLWDIEPPLPIPLTPEILSKCIFPNFCDYHVTYNKESITKYGKAVYWLQDKEDFAKQITSVHQFQNLCFALTGEELKVQL